MTILVIIAILLTLYLECFIYRDPIRWIKENTPWESGRQNTGYKRHTLFTSKYFKMDCHLLFFPNGTYIPKHRDANLLGDHYRLNIVLSKPDGGGIFYCKKCIFQLLDRIYLFRPDLYEHSVSPVRGERLVLSFGKVL